MSQAKATYERRGDADAQQAISPSASPAGQRIHGPRQLSALGPVREGSGLDTTAPFIKAQGRQHVPDLCLCSDPQARPV